MAEGLEARVKVLKASVGEIIDSLFYRPFKPWRQNGTRRGQILHYRLGFNNAELFQRYYQIMDYIILVRGCPDRIQPPYVDELKTCRHILHPKINKAAEYQLQLYMWLTGLTKGRLYVYYIDRGELVKEATYQYDPEKVYWVFFKWLVLREMRQACTPE